MQINFVKMHGLGNDFMVVDWPVDRPLPDAGQLRLLADRRLGIGFDSLLAIAPADGAADTFSYRVFNADGSEAEQCGNGARCIARHVAAPGQRELTLLSKGGPVAARVLDGGRISINLGEPNFRPAALPFDAAEADSYTLELSQGPVSFGVVSMGNPHAVIAVDSADAAPVGILGPELATHRAFPQGVNVGFAERQSDTRLKLRVYERGVGETRACGTGAAAAMATGRRRGQLAETVEVELPGGVLTVSWPGPGSPLWQTGQTSVVYEGQIEL
jgi:diaminopimelate epimerase